jgi:hypothetical protein
MSEETINEQDEIILDLFAQGCSTINGKYNHSCISAYENAQEYLLRKGLIKKEDCEFN